MNSLYKTEKKVLIFISDILVLRHSVLKRPRADQY